MAHQPGRGDRHLCLHSCRDVRRDSLLNERRCRRKTPRSECGRHRRRRAQGRRIVWTTPDKAPTWYPTQAGPPARSPLVRSSCVVMAALLANETTTKHNQVRLSFLTAQRHQEVGPALPLLPLPTP